MPETTIKVYDTISSQLSLKNFASLIDFVIY